MVVIRVLRQHFGPILPGVLGVHGPQPGPYGKRLGKAHVAQQLPGVVIQHQIRLDPFMIADNYGAGHYPISLIQSCYILWERRRIKQLP